EEYNKDGIIREIEGFAYKPKISIITPVYNIASEWLDRCINSTINQFYRDWELCLYDDGSSNNETISSLNRWSGLDKRVKVSFGEANLGIAAASNQALRMATGEFIALLDNDDELSPDALYECVKLLNNYPDTDVIYSDEDKIFTDLGSGVTKRFDPFFKPDWNPQLLFSSMYIGHLTLYRRDIIDGIGGFRSDLDYSQDYDMALRATEITDRIRHIPKILYHWRAIDSSAAAGGKDYARESNISALEDAAFRRDYHADVIAYPFANRVRFNLERRPLVSIIIPTDSRDNILNCLEHLLKHTDYPSYEVIIVTNSALGAEIAGIYKKRENIRIYNFDKPFNFSLKCNEGASIAKGEYLLFLNDDIEAV
ncbi:MAG: glycosyltransferase, partial [Nitrospirae bacterium]|nr:glycosyltransferase [Nitrospirota bacterium]